MGKVFERMDVPTDSLGIPPVELLPGILNEITLTHIAPKLSWGAFHVLSSVSRGWRLALPSSKQFYDGRVCSNSTETLAVVSVELSNHTDAIALYSVRDERFYYIPEIPHLGGFPLACQCISLGSKLYVLGGVKDSLTQLGSDEVYVLDLAGERQWRQSASMGEGRREFGLGAIDGEIFVFAGHSAYSPIFSSEVYDPEEDIWSFSPWENRFKHRVTAEGKELVLHGRMKYGDHYYWDWKENVRDVRRFDWIINAGANLLVEEAYYVDKTRLLEFCNPETGACYTALKDILSAGQGKFSMISSSNIHVYEIDDEISCTGYRSISTGSILPQDADVVQPFVTIVADDELLAILNWFDNEKDIEEQCLVRSTGFSRKDGEMVWQRAPWSGKHKPIHMNDIMCSIQL